ncbi:hypothetical protein PQ472_01340 [Lacticaseibacillus pabuli]|uniref:Uncharacterized protein n=1 Tax=Lacticaseibacillus pabuli TaxID=3025672 RepID=A0ABY7WV30_9LACO|nr:hypothetical protein [Lacticaseibacillus sp. KACC 23028]WDF82914.1 hypothetical protein PQ472_01340 [Lacticaseibacillus sp. KACC 23028]
MLILIWQLVYGVIVIGLISLFLMQMELLPNWYRVWHYMRTAGFSITNFKVAFKEYMWH